MSINIQNYKELFESISKFPVYPLIVPQEASYPCIVMKIINNGRDGDSNLARTNIVNDRATLTIIGPNLSKLYDIEKNMVDELDNTNTMQSETKLLSITHVGTVPLYNYGTSMYELTVDFLTKPIK